MTPWTLHLFRCDRAFCRLFSFLVGAVLLGWHLPAWSGGLELSPNTRLGVVQKTLRPKRIALLIGISKYQHTSWNDLKYPGQDVAKMRDFLQKKGGFDEIISFVKPHQTTQRGIRQGLKWLKARNRSSQDTVLVYVSGHGTIAQRRSGVPLERYLVASDSTQDVPKTGVAMAELRAALGSLPSRRKVVILATCYVGLIKAKKRPGRVKGLHAGTKGQYQLGWVSRSMLVLSAAGYMQPAYELEQLKGDVYTHFLLACARDLLRRKKQVTAAQAHQCATPKTYRFVRRILGREQAPAIEAKIMGRDRLFLAGARLGQVTRHQRRPGGWLKLMRHRYKEVKVRPLGSKGPGQSMIWQDELSEGTLTMRLPPGRYELYLFTPSQRLIRRRIEIHPDQTTWLGPREPTLPQVRRPSYPIPVFELPQGAFFVDVGPDLQMGERWQVGFRLGLSTPYAGGGVTFAAGEAPPGSSAAGGDVLFRFGLMGQFGYPILFEPFDLFLGVYAEVGLWSPYEVNASDMVFLLMYGPQARLRWWFGESFALRLTVALLFSLSPDKVRNPNAVIKDYDWTHRPHVNIMLGFDFGLPGL